MGSGWIFIVLFQCRTRLCGWCNRDCYIRSRWQFSVSMPHAALWVVQPSRGGAGFVVHSGFNAARGFVGGATKDLLCSQVERQMFQCRTRLCGWCNQALSEKPFGWWRVSMPHAALWVVQLTCLPTPASPLHCFNAARGFVGGATRSDVTQNSESLMFQCRTRLCGWCNDMQGALTGGTSLFQCRTRLCGWCNDLLSVV